MSDRDMRGLVVRVAAFVCATALAACSFPDPPFDTHADAARLQALRTKEVALVQFEHADRTIYGAFPPPPAAVAAALRHDREQLAARLGGVFTVIDATAAAAARAPSWDDPDHDAKAGRLVAALGHDAGIFVRQSYGFELVSGSLSDELRQQLLEGVFSEKTAQAINGPVQVQNYDLASDVRIIDREGRVLWRLWSKAQDWPKAGDLFNPGEFARGVAGLDPSTALFARSFARLTDLHADFVAWALARDMDGAGAPQYRVFLGERRSAITIAPGDSKAYAPFLCGYDVMAETRKKLKQPEPPECRPRA